MKYIFMSLVCKFKGHKEEFAGSCPFTGSRYNYCHRCGGMIPLDYVD